jgi:hypothetical protein
MFIFKNFVFNPALLEDLSEEDKALYNIDTQGEYVLEILKGRIIFGGYITSSENNPDVEHLTTLIFNDNTDSSE